jgi:aminoglycoside phosphotransferase (APT) family kinase protein
VQLLASGREADVYALDDRRVLRRYRCASADVIDEARIMRYVRDHGFPVPQVFEAQGTDMIMERLTGPTMGEALLANSVALKAAAEMLADLLEQLHAIPAWPIAVDSSTIVHLDIHPENVMLTADGPVLIDWANATAGPADLDTAFTALILAQVAIGSIVHPLAADAGIMLDHFLDVAPGDPTRLLDDVVAIRARQSTMSADEVAALPVAAARVRGNH